jgi:hypothetical protein
MAVAQPAGQPVTDRYLGPSRLWTNPMEGKDVMSVVARLSAIRKVLEMPYGNARIAARHTWVIPTRSYTESQEWPRYPGYQQHALMVLKGPIYDMYITLRDFSSVVVPQPFVPMTPDFTLVPMSSMWPSHAFQSTMAN